MKDRLLTRRSFGLIAFAALALSVSLHARAEPPQMGQRALPATVPRHSDAMPQPPPPNVEPQDRQQPTVQAERAGSWHSPETGYPPQYRYVPGTYYPWRSWHRPSHSFPHYQTYGNRRASRFRRSRWGW